LPSVLSSIAGAALALITAYGLGAFLLRRRTAPPEIALALGAIVESLLVVLLLTANLAYLAIFTAIAILAVAAAWRMRPGPVPPVSVPRWAFVIFLPYGVWYLVNTLAPEITPDGITYHLGLAREYVRLGGFPDHTYFYDLIPQGMEMLYTVAYAIGKHPAAKLVEFAFFLGGVPLIFRVGKRLGLDATGSTLAAVFYFTAPVIGLTGSSSYNDAAGVFFLLAALYLLLDERFFTAGLCAGFCYAIKMPGLLVPGCVVLWLLPPRRMRAAAMVSVGVAIVIAPWMLRSLLLTGNPFAPLASRVFPNPYFHIATETELASGLRSMHGIPFLRAPWELAFGDGFAGTYGPLVLALPIGLLALRRRAGRLLWLAALVLALPWITNSGGRFLMQSFVLAIFALALALPRPLALAAIALQAVSCWPHVLDVIQPSYSFRLHEFPISAALGIESEPDYLKRHLEEFDVARMIEKGTPPDARILALLSVANAYLDRDVAVTWQSAEADVLHDTLRLAALYTKAPTFDWRASWPEQDVRVLRFLLPVSYDGEFDINELQIFSGDTLVANSPQWTFTGKPNHWEGPLAIDGNLATRWRTWEPVRAGMSFDIDFGHPQRITSAVLVSHAPVFGKPLEVWGKDAKGQWRQLAGDAQATARAPQDLRLDAARALRKAGFRYVLTPTGTGGNAPIGNTMIDHEADWGMERAGEAGRFYLLRVK
jgi:hypothetical protein